MNVKYLLDTSVIAEPLKVNRNDGVMHKLRAHSKECAIASVTWNELHYGYNRLPESEKKSILQMYLKTIVFPILPYDAYAAEWHAFERARLAKIGRTPPFADGQIAAVAFTNSLQLVTFNTNDFSAFSEIKIVDWRT